VLKKSEKKNNRREVFVIRDSGRGRVGIHEGKKKSTGKRSVMVKPVRVSEGGVGKKKISEMEKLHWGRGPKNKKRSSKKRLFQVDREKNRKRGNMSRVPKNQLEEQGRPTA